MKLVIFTGTYNGYYADAEESIALPAEANENIIFGKFEEGTIYENVVDFGELEGKHSECYGDLSVEYVDTDEMSDGELIELVDKLSPLDRLEVFLEHNSINWWEENVEGAENEEEITNKEKELLDDWDAYQIYNVPDKVLELLKEKYMVQTQTLKIKESDYEKALSLLKENEIEVL